MKTNKLLLSLIATAAALTSSCSNQESPSVPSSGEAGAVSFSSYISKSSARASSTTSDNMADFGVTAFLGDGSGYSGTLVPDFMYNQLVEKPTDAWTYTPIKYWPSDASKKVSFFAYSPYAAAPSASSDGKSSITAVSANNVQGDPTISFEVGTDVSKQIDLVYAKAVDQTNAVGTVQLDFKHALSRVEFKAVGWEPGTGDTYDSSTTVTINAVKLATERMSATLNLNSGEWSDPEDDSSLHAYTLSTRNGLLQNNVISSGDTSEKQLTLDDGYMMVLPDLSGSDQYVLFVDYTVVTQDPSLEDGQFITRSNVYRRFSPGFEAGKSYSIVIHLGMNGGTSEDDGDDDGEVPEDPDPDPTDPVDPTPPSKNNYVRFSASVNAWDNSSSDTIIPLTK